MSAHEADPAYDAAPERAESEAERIDRNWLELLQELRISQTGGQILTGFLLTIPFQEGFEDLAFGFRLLYLCVLSLALLSAVLLLAPVMVHRTSFRTHRKDKLLYLSNRLAICGLALLGAALIGAVWLVFGVVLGAVAGAIAAVVMAVVVAGALVMLPWTHRRGTVTDRYAG